MSVMLANDFEGIEKMSWPGISISVHGAGFFLMMVFQSLFVVWPTMQILLFI
jgi:hypothetical protein